MPVAPLAALGILAGAAAGACLDVGRHPWIALAACAWIAAVVAFAAARPRAFGCALTIGCAAAGGALAHHDAAAAIDPPLFLQTQPDAAGSCPAGLSGRDAPCPDGPLLLEGRLRDDAELTEAGAAFTLDATRVWIGGAPVPTSGGVRLSVGGAFAAARAGAWRAGRTLRVRATLRRPQAYRNFGTADQEIRTALRGIRLFGTVKSADLVQVTTKASVFGEAAASARARIRRVVAASVGSIGRDAAAVVIAVLIGDRAGLSPEVQARLQRAGTFHVIAISGGNIAILAGLALWTLRVAGLAPRIQAVLALVAIAAYAGVASGGSSVARATLGASLYLVARTLDHRATPRAIVAVGAGVLVAARPLLVLDVGFWLTFVAALAILEQAAHVAERGLRCCSRLDAGRVTAGLRPAVMLLSATLVAEGSLVAITAYVFAQVTAGGVVLNFVAVPLMAVVQVAGLGVVACGLLHPALAWPPAYVAAWAARGILDSARVVDLVPWAAPQVVPPPLWLAATMTVSWWAAWWLPHRAARRACAALWLAGLAAILAGVPLASSGRAHLVPWRHPPCGVPETPRVYAPHGWLRVVFLDVGQGGATSVQFPDGTAALVDAGGSAAASRFDVGARIVLPALRALGVRRLSTLVLTHGDLDHVGGAPAVLDGFRPLEVWEGIPVSTHVPMRELASRASMLGVPWMQVRSGGTRVRGPVTLRVWHPPEPDWERRRVRNDDSVVIEMRFGDVSVLLPGDIGADVEAILARRIPRAPIRVIEAAHHGSGGSTSTAWLDALDPAAAVVSAGRDNRHGHPSPAVLERLRERRIAVFRSDRDGAVLLDTNGVGVWMTTCAEASSGSGAPSRAAQTRWAPGRPDSMQKEAAVETGAPGVVTNGTTR